MAKRKYDTDYMRYGYEFESFLNYFSVVGLFYFMFVHESTVESVKKG